MPLTRRKLVLAAGVGGVALLGAGSRYRAISQTTNPEQPWGGAQSAPTDVRLDSFRYAILAPNPHNRQPWRIRLVGTSDAIISCNLSRRLPETDPYDRQITIGFGCFLELARIAAAERSVRVESTLFPDGEPQLRLDGRPVARLRFLSEPGLAKDPLFEAIVRRRSTKAPYDIARAIRMEDAQSLRAFETATTAVHTAREDQTVPALRDLTWKAMEIELKTGRTHRESINLTRIGRAEVNANPDGVSLNGIFIETLAFAGLLTREKLIDPSSFAYNSGVDMQRDQMLGTASYVWVSTLGNSRVDQINAGTTYVRLNLHATQLGLCMHPASQALQEYAEMKQSFRAVQSLTGMKDGERLQMLARIGYGPSVDPAPRWPVATALDAT